jgi:hypothetical protein
MSSSMLPATIFVTFRENGFHHWADAPEHQAYMRNMHRHAFHIRVDTIVSSDHPDIDPHELLRESQRRFMDLHLTAQDPRNFGSQSCVILAGRLSTVLADLFARPFTVTVSEDGETGATVSSAPEG